MMFWIGIWISAIACALFAGCIYMHCYRRLCDAYTNGYVDGCADVCTLMVDNDALDRQTAANLVRNNRDLLYKKLVKGFDEL